MNSPAPVFVRRASVADVALERHELTALVTPYNSPAPVVDEVDGRPDRYLEEFAPRAFDAQVRRPALHRGIALRDGHDNRTRSGYALELGDDAAGLVARFRVLPDAFENIATMLEDGVDGVSVGFIALRTRERHDAELGVVRRRTAALVDHVALEPIQAYGSARVLALRAADELAQMPAPPTPARDELADYLNNRRNPT